MARKTKYGRWIDTLRLVGSLFASAVGLCSATDCSTTLKIADLPHFRREVLDPKCFKESELTRRCKGVAKDNVGTGAIRIVEWMSDEMEAKAFNKYLPTTEENYREWRSLHERLAPPKNMAACWVLGESGVLWLRLAGKPSGARVAYGEDFTRFKVGSLTASIEDMRAYNASVIGAKRRTQETRVTLFVRVDSKLTDRKRQEIGDAIQRVFKPAKLHVAFSQSRWFVPHGPVHLVFGGSEAAPTEAEIAAMREGSCAWQFGKFICVP